MDATQSNNEDPKMRNTDADPIIEEPRGPLVLKHDAYWYYLGWPLTVKWLRGDSVGEGVVAPTDTENGDNRASNDETNNSVNRAGHRGSVEASPATLSKRLREFQRQVQYRPLFIASGVTGPLTSKKLGIRRHKPFLMVAVAVSDGPRLNPLLQGPTPSKRALGELTRVMEREPTWLRDPFPVSQSFLYGFEDYIAGTYVIEGLGERKEMDFVQKPVTEKPVTE
ncbi:hypothetical protein C8F04DRAFT_1113611 [Mycena alexandri]|uniref:Uncharacterized protein n=1 Tax=Mycena alexandri TaxID=1745969 RepID=A0AAD6X0L5_9AGAR|nr:hypothetical protein C8F04DRAFT_1113611 [Mycena alexandri]